MSFNFITDPDTLMAYSIFSEKGLSMLKNYVREFQEGGAAAEAEAEENVEAEAALVREAEARAREAEARAKEAEARLRKLLRLEKITNLLKEEISRAIDSDNAEAGANTLTSSFNISEQAAEDARAAVVREAGPAGAARAAANVAANAAAEWRERAAAGAAARAAAARAAAE